MTIDDVARLPLYRNSAALLCATMRELLAAGLPPEDIAPALARIADAVSVDHRILVDDVPNGMTALRPFVLAAQLWTCIYCGDMEGPFEVDHIHPKSRGGRDEYANLGCACRACNRAKGNKTLDQWAGRS